MTRPKKEDREENQRVRNIVKPFGESIIPLIDQIGKNKFGESKFTKKCNELNKKLNKLEPQFRVD